MVIRQQWIVLAFLVLGVVAGAHGTWIHYPLSSPIRGLDWRSLDPSWWRSFAAAPFIICMFSAVYFLLSNNVRIGSVFLAAAAVAILAIPEYILLGDSFWFKTYIDDGLQHDKFQFLIPFLGGTPSTNFDPYLNSPDKFQYLPDRARIVMAMLGWGWIVSLIGLLALMMLLRRLGKLPSLRRVLLASGAGVLLIGMIFSGALRADLAYRKGDQQLELGNYGSALKAYARAIELDPQLANSSVYLHNVSKAYYQTGGANDPRAYLYMADVVTAVGQEGAKALLATTTTTNDGSELGRALNRMALRRISELWINEGVRAYKHGDFGTVTLGLRRVLSQHQDWRHARFFLARVLGELRQFDDAASQLNDLLPTINNNSIKAAIYSALGDVHAAAGHVAEARRHYVMSYSLDKSSNLWAIKGLGGT